MPRLSNKYFLLRHRFLKRVWSFDSLRSLFSYLSPNDQMDLHQYYQVVNDDGDAEVVKTRKTVNAGDKSLTNRASKAFARLVSVYCQAAIPLEFSSLSEAHKAVPRVAKTWEKKLLTSKTKQKSSSDFKLQAIMRPKIDMHKLARLFITIAIEQINNKNKNSGPDTT